MKDYKIRVNEKQSEEIQKICFEYGLEWYGGGKTIKDTEKPFLFIYWKVNKCIVCTPSKEIFKNHENEKIKAEDFIQKHGNFKYQIKEWDDLIKEFGFNDDEDVNCRGHFVINMKYLCGRKIKNLDNIDGHTITKEMVVDISEKKPKLSFDEFMQNEYSEYNLTTIEQEEQFYEWVSELTYEDWIKYVEIYTLRIKTKLLEQ